MTTVTNTTNVIDQILAASEAVIVRMVEAMDAEYLRVMERPADKYDTEYHRLVITWNLVKSVNKYTLPTDELVEVVADWARGAKVTISGRIARGGISYRFETEVIIAGGYNIQCAHYRYLTHTKLPQTGGSEAADIFKAKLSKLTKAQKLAADLKGLELRLTSRETDLTEKQALTNEEIYILHDTYGTLTKRRPYAEVKALNAGTDWNKSEEEFNGWYEGIKEMYLEHHATRIQMAKSEIKSIKAQIIKLRAKIEAL